MIQDIELSRPVNWDYGGNSDGLKQTRIRGATLYVSFRSILVLNIARSVRNRRHSWYPIPQAFPAFDLRVAYFVVVGMSAEPSCGFRHPEVLQSFG